MSEETKINISAIKENINKAFIFLKQKKVINIIIIALMLFLLIGSSWIRLQNLPLLKDSTTGKYIPLALDPFYFLRLAETILEQGGLSEYDVMRQPFNVSFSNEILPQTVVFMYKAVNIFYKDVTIQYIDVISPVVFFILGLIIFFFLVYVLTKSKIAALISSIFLALIPTYLYRTMAGFSDHESIGMFAFFLTLLGYTLALKFLNKQEKEGKKKNYLLKTILFGLFVGFLSAFTIASWVGIANFILIIIPLSFGLFWLLKTQDLEKNKENLFNFLIFYIIFFVSTILFGLIYGFDFSSIIGQAILSNYGLINTGILLFLIIDFLIIKFRGKISFIKKEKLEKYRVLFSFGITIIISIIFLILAGKNVFSLILDFINKLLYPFGTGRVGLTIAENAQPYLNDWQNQIGKIFFWLFFGGLVTIGIEFVRGIKQKKHKVLLIILWIFMISGILFSRISANSLFNGTNFISKLFYIGSLILFFGYFIWIYFKEKFHIKPELLIIFFWMFFMLISTRGAIRLFFVITPLACFSVGFLFYNIFKYMKKSGDDLLKTIIVIIMIGMIIASLFSLNNFVTASSQQAKYTGPSANSQWQNAMAWVRENTQKNSIFVHWWDYGYWVEYLGKRPVLADGGHFEGAFRDHLIGRYLLTTPYPETALSFMKTNNVSYLLIDPTDLGKYSAYSSIGGDESGNDRLSSLPIMVLDSKQTQETSDSIIRFYQGVSTIDEDIVHNTEQGQVFLPQNKGLIIGTILKMKQSGDEISFTQPEAVFLYNQQQIRIPVRYIYFNDNIIDFKQGLESTLFILPTAAVNNNQVQTDRLGSLIYLSPKVSKSLFAQLYLMNDAFNNYPSLKLAHSEQESNLNLLKAQGAIQGDFAYFNGFRGPIKIWKVNYPSNIIVREEFLRMSGEYAEFDDLRFVK